MKLKIIDYGCKPEYKLKRFHDYDAGADVYLQNDICFKANETTTVKLGFGIEIPAGFVGFILPRSSMASAGLVCQPVPIDAGYTGEIHAIVSNNSRYDNFKKAGFRIGQLVIVPCLLPEFTDIINNSRGNGGFGSTGK